jgi:hypothetical protein
MHCNIFVCIVYLTTLSVPRTVLCRMVGLMNDYLEDAEGSGRSLLLYNTVASLEVLRQTAKNFGQASQPVLKMEATCSSDTSVDFQRTTRCYI